MQQLFRPVPLSAFAVIFLAVSGCAKDPVIPPPTSGGSDAGVDDAGTHPTKMYAIGGTVSEIVDGTFLELQSGDETLRVDAPGGEFTFATELADQASYEVTVKTQPRNQLCTVENGSGTVNGGPVTDVQVNCVGTFTLGGTVTGLRTNLSVELQNGDEVLTLNAPDGAFTFTKRLADKAAYTVTVKTPPNGFMCDVTNGSGAIDGKPVTDVTITCTSLLVDCYGVPASTMCVPETEDALLFGALTSAGAANSTQLFRASGASTQSVQLTPFSTAANPQPSHPEAVRSADRKMIAFVSNEGWTSLGGGSPVIGSIYITRSDGTKTVKLTQNPIDECWEWGPRFSHDGQWLVFSRACNRDRDGTKANIEYLFRIRSNGAQQELMMDTEMQEILNFGIYSLDDKTVYAGVDRGGGWAIVAMNAESKHQFDVIDLAPLHSYFVHWAGVLSNGDVLFEQKSFGPGGPAIPTLNRIDVRTQTVTKIRDVAQTSNSALVDMDFVVAPDGTDRVAYQHYDEVKKTFQIMVSDLNGMNAKAVSEEFYYIRWLTWGR